MKNLLFSIVLFVLCGTQLQAQVSGYRTAIGARLGVPFSASLKHFVNSSHAVEAIVGVRGNKNWRFTNVGVAYQVHKDWSSVASGLNWYYGLGANAYFWTYDDGFLGDNDYAATSFGVSGYLGLDYKFKSAPFNLSLDWIPTFFAGRGFNRGFGADYGSLAVRYTIK